MNGNADASTRVRWWQSVTARLALAWALLSTLAIGAVFGLLYWRAVGVVEQQAADTVAAEIRSLAEHYAEAGLLGVVRVVQERSAGAREAEPVYLVIDPFGNRLAGNLLAWPHTIPPDGVWRQVELYRRGEDRPVLIGARAHAMPGGARLLVGRALAGRLLIQEAIGEAMLWALGALWTLAVGGGLLLSRTILRRVDEVARINRDVMVGDLGRRVPERGSGDEFDRLAASMNAMLERIEELMVGMRTVTDSIGHDLRSPLTRLRTRLERIQSADSTAEGRRDAAEAAVGDVDSILDLLGRLLDIARAEAGLNRDQMTEVDLASIARDVVEMYGPVAEDRGLAIEVSAALAVPVTGHGELVAQAVSNLVDNATKYARRQICVAVWTDAGAARLRVSDDGPGVPPGDRERATQRFVRLDPSRSGQGAGLGLSLVAAVVRLHGGSLLLDDAGPGLQADMILPERPPKR